MPRVSVGLPVYNGEHFVGAALKSLLSQSFEDFELIVSDNASSDATEAICRDIAAGDSRVRYDRNEVNLGAARNLNLVLERATGEYFKWAAHDDTCRPDFLARCVEALDEHPGAVLAYTGAIQVDERDQQTRRYTCGLDVSDLHPSTRFAHVLSGPPHWWLPIFGLMRRNVLGRKLRHGNYPGGDHVFLTGLSLYGIFAEVHEDLFVHRQHIDRYVARYRGGSEWQEKLAYWDPGRPAGAYRWWRLRGYYGTVAASPLPLNHRLRCYRAIGQWAVKHKRGLAADIVRAGPRLARR
jgi:glycosyltransferase involved in cell wall biosynthesis